jgi:putative ABC transport system permease protein
VWIVAVVIAAAVTALAGRIVTAGAGTPAAWIWACAGLAVAALIVAAGHFAPFLTSKTAAANLKAIGPQGVPLWRRMYLDLILLAVGIVFFVNTAAGGFQVVLAPEGVLQSSVSYDAFAGPFLLWLGGGLFVRRLAEMWLSNRALLVAMYRGFAGNLAGIVAAAISRQHTVIGRGLTIVALAVAFAVSTALFNETYNAQARIDAELTNGADVAIALPNAAGDSGIRGLALIPGVAGTDVMQHRFAYVGQDLQDLYAIDPSTIGKATDMSNAFFGNHDARATLSRLASQPDGALLAEETIADFQLHDGDRINLRLQSGRVGKYRPVQFTFVGAVREFPTAPRDSFIVANAAYIDRATGIQGTRVVLLRAGSRDPSAIAADARSKVSGIAGARVSDIVTAQRIAGSSLTAVDLHGLTGIELAFALLLLIGASGLSLGLGFAERRSNFVILAALGATPQQVGSFLWAEAGTIVLGGIAGGIVLGVAVAAVLVKVLTGVFDPPPEMLAVPWPYLGALTVLAVAATAIVVMWSRSASTRGIID